MQAPQLDNSQTRLTTLTMRLAKVSRSSTVMRVSGAASDQRPDLYRTRFTRQLYESFLKRRAEIEPYLSVAHFLTPVGTIDRLYVDGRYLKLTGEVDLTTSLGRALGNSLEDPTIRAQTGFSVGFDSEDCYHDDTAGGLLTYVGGRLIHVAFTSMPGNPRSRLVSVEMSRATAMLRDATRLVGPLQAAYLARRDRQTLGRDREDEEEPEERAILRHPGHGDERVHAGKASGTPTSVQSYLDRQPPERRAYLSERWTPTTKTEAKSLGKLASIPGAGTHVVDGRTFRETITVQLPKKTGGTRERLEKAVENMTPKITTLDPHSLTATQTYISRDGIAGAINGVLGRPGSRPSYTAHVKVARTNQGDMIVDGHHRTHAAIMIGERSMPVALYDLR